MSKRITLNVNSKHTIEIDRDGIKPDVHLLAVMREHGIAPDCCGGNGMCARCKIRFLTMPTLPTAVERSVLSADELREGYRLACCVKLRSLQEEHITIVTAFVKEEIPVLEDFSTLIIGRSAAKDTASQCSMQDSAAQDSAAQDSAAKDFIIADIGTTTLVLKRISPDGKTVKGTYRALNPQRTFGTDVIARIRASMEGYREALKDAIQKEFASGIRYLMQEEMEENAAEPKVTDIYVSANTAMKQLFVGNDVSGMGSYPFTVEKKVTGTVKFMEYNLHFIPDAGTFVGSDIVAGVYALDMHMTDEVNLLIDLGTNGELVMGGKKGLVATATAAGPAFENTKTFYIPGSDIIRMVSDMLDAGIIDREGLLIESYFETGYPVNGVTITQEDIRNVQKAKAAIRCGIETLIKIYGTDRKDISHIYLAGGFGHGLCEKSAVRIGLIPKEFEDKVVSVLNTSLGGAYKLGLNYDERTWDEINKIADSIKVINLAEDENFANGYVEALNF